MKILQFTILSFLGFAAAFSPSGEHHRLSKPTQKGLSMSDNGKELFVPPVTVPCFGAAPFLTGDVFFGENYWNKLTSEYGTAETGTFIRAA